MPCFLEKSLRIISVSSMMEMVYTAHKQGDGNIGEYHETNCPDDTKNSDGTYGEYYGRWYRMIDGPNVGDYHGKY